MNVNNQPYCLSTWLGSTDLRAIAAANFACAVLAHTHKDGPINLLHPDLNLTSAKTDLSNIKVEISSKIIRLASPLVLNTFFIQLFPGYLKEPHAALNHVRQTYNNQNGNAVFSIIYDY